MKPVESTGLGFFHLSTNSIIDLKVSCGGRFECNFFRIVQCPQGLSKLYNPSADENYKVQLKTKILLRYDIRYHLYIFFLFLISNFTFSADGYYEVQLMTKAVLRFDGVVIWQPPATYKGTPAK